MMNNLKRRNLFIFVYWNDFYEWEIFVYFFFYQNKLENEKVLKNYQRIYKILLNKHDTKWKERIYIFSYILSLVMVALKLFSRVSYSLSKLFLKVVTYICSRFQFVSWTPILQISTSQCTYLIFYFYFFVSYYASRTPRNFDYCDDDFAIISK